MTAIGVEGGPHASTTAPDPNRVVSGYWFASLPGKGFGILHATGPVGGTAHARFLGTTRPELAANLHYAVASLHAEQAYEVAGGTGKLIDTALSKGSAWASGPAGVSWDVMPTAILATVLTAGLAGGAVGAGALAGEEAAGATGAAVAGGTAAAEAGGSTAAGAAAGGAAGGVAGGAAKAVGKGAAKVAGKAVGAVAKNPGKALAALSIAGLFTDIGWWKGAGMIVAGAILLILAIRELT